MARPLSSRCAAVCGRAAQLLHLRRRKTIIRPLPFISVAGRRLEYLRIEPTRDRRPTLVFLHAGLGSVSLWQDFPAALCRRTGCGGLVYSRYGHGKSERIRERLSPTFMHDEAQVVLPALLNVFQIRTPILIGHSDGASIALIYAGTAAERPDALILEAPHVFVEDLTIAGIEQARPRFIAGRLRERLAAHHGENVDTLFAAWTDVWLSGGFRSWNIEELPAADRVPDLRHPGSSGRIRNAQAGGSRGTEVWPDEVNR